MLVTAIGEERVEAALVGGRPVCRLLGPLVAVGICGLARGADAARHALAFPRRGACLR
jgi:hypothetical protein